MKNRIGYFLFALVVIGGSAAAEGIAFEHTSWAEVLKKSKATKRPVFVDFYAVWCGPCKMMTRDVFTQDEVGAYFNTNFISFKIDAEKEELQLVQSIGLDAYPTLAFFDSDGKMIQKQVGAIDGGRLISLGKSVVEYPKKKANIQAGKATHEEIMQYLANAKGSDPETFNRLAPPLVKAFTIDDIKQDIPWKILVQSPTDLPSPQFQMVVNNAGTLNQLHTDFREYANEVMGRYFSQMIEAGNLAGLDIYKKNMQTIFQQFSQKTFDYKYFDLWVNSDYYLQRKDLSQYASSLIQFVDTYMKEDSDRMAASAISLSGNMTDEASRKKAIEWAQSAVKINRAKETVFSLAKVYENTGDKVKAAATANEVLAFELADEERQFVNNYVAGLKQ